MPTKKRNSELQYWLTRCRWYLIYLLGLCKWSLNIYVTHY